MAKLSDILITEQQYTQTEEITINCKGSDFVFGIRPKSVITREDMQELITYYYDLTPETATAPFTVRRGECARYSAFVKYVIDDDGRHDLDVLTIIGLPIEVKKELDNHIPTTMEVLSSFKDIIPKAVNIGRS